MSERGILGGSAQAVLGESCLVVSPSRPFALLGLKEPMDVEDLNNAMLQVLRDNRDLITENRQLKGANAALQSDVDHLRAELDDAKRVIARVSRDAGMR